MSKSARLQPGVKLRDADKMALIPVKVIPSDRKTMLKKPSW
ncbi:MAG: lipoyl synthase, partial [Psychrosphaera sp.]|nr:lipoyl synthase [Psychrosphaera sp.]